MNFDINKFIAGLSEFQKKLLVVAIVIVIFAIMDRIFIGPTMSSISSIEDDITKEEATIKQDIRFLGFKDRIVKESDEISPYITKEKPTDDEIAFAFQEKIENLASQAKVTIAKFTPGTPEQDAAYWKYSADLECTGNLADIVVFMHLINSQVDLMKVDKFDFSAKKAADTDEIKATMTIEKIVVTEKPMPAKAQDANTNTTQTPPSAATP